MGPVSADVVHFQGDNLIAGDFDEASEQSLLIAESKQDSTTTTKQRAQSIASQIKPSSIFDPQAAFPPTSIPRHLPYEIEEKNPSEADLERDWELKLENEARLADIANRVPGPEDPPSDDEKGGFSDFDESDEEGDEEGDEKGDEKGDEEGDEAGNEEGHEEGDEEGRSGFS